MATAVADRATRASAPESVEADLAALWRDLAGHRPVARAVMSNLIVCRRGEVTADSAADVRADAADTDGAIEEVMGAHPSRTIVLDHDRCDEASPVIGAGVCVCLFGDPAARYGVEKIVV